MGGMYIVSAIQNIEKQFRLPSKLSGILVSASEFCIESIILVILTFSKIISKFRRYRLHPNSDFHRVLWRERQSVKHTKYFFWKSEEKRNKTGIQKNKMQTGRSQSEFFFFWNWDYDSSKCDYLRARWIGAGTLGMAVAYLLIASPNFLFPTPPLARGTFGYVKVRYRTRGTQATVL